MAATTPSLGVAASFGILTDVFVNTAPGNIINGDVGYITAPAMNPTVNGTTHTGADATYLAASTGQDAALSDLNSQPCTWTGIGITNLGTDTTHNPSLPAGVYEP